MKRWTNSDGLLDPSSADINFAVPSLAALYEDSKSSATLSAKDITPGMLKPMVEAMIESSEKDVPVAYKVSVDGKMSVIYSFRISYI